MKDHGKYTEFCRTYGKTLSKQFCITGLCEVEGSNCCSPLGVTYLSGFNGVLVFLLFLELNSRALPDLESPCHWQRVLGQVVYSNKAYLQVLDIPAIHLGSLSRRIVNIHPQSVPAGTLPCVSGSPLPQRQEELISSSACSF